MERKQYLELCQKNAIGQQIRIKYKEFVYRPYRYELGFDDKGNPIHSAILMDLKTTCLFCCGLDELKEDSYEMD